MAFAESSNQRVTAGTATSLTWTQVGGDGEPADPGTVTVDVARADGSVIATGAATVGAGAVARTYALTAAQTANIDRLLVSWKVSGTTVAQTEIDIASTPWFSNAQLRVAEPILADPAKYTAATITLARLQVEAFFERITHRRFCPGYRYEIVEVNGSNPIPVRDNTLNDGSFIILNNVDIRAVRSLKTYNDPRVPLEVFAAGEVAAMTPSLDGVITRPGNLSFYGKLAEVGYVYGTVSPPADVLRQAMRLTREILVESKSQIPDSATTWSSTDLGWSAVLLTPGVRGAHTRLPTVNECLDGNTFEMHGWA